MQTWLDPFCISNYLFGKMKNNLNSKLQIFNNNNKMETIFKNGDEEES